MLGVQATGPAKEGWLDARLAVEGVASPIRTDRTWLIASSPPPNDWCERGGPAGYWRAPEFREPATRRIGGDEAALFFRKTLKLKDLPETAPLLRGRTRLLARRRAEVVYDFRDPEELADWHTDGRWGWAKSALAGSRGGLYSPPFRTAEIEVEAVADIASSLTIGIWGDDASRSTGIRLSLNSPHRYVATLRSGTHTVATGKLPLGSELHRITLRKDGDRLVVLVDGREIIAERDANAGELGQLWRVGFQVGIAAKVILGAVRITGEPDWPRLEAENAQRNAPPPPQPPAKAP